MHLIYVCNEYPPAPYGGIGVFVRTIAKELVKHGFKISVIGVYDNLAEVKQENDNGVQVYRLPAKKIIFGSTLANRLYFYWWVERFIRDEQVDLIEYPDFHSYFWHKHSIPTVVRLHGSTEYSVLHGRSKNYQKTAVYFEKRAIRLADHLVGVSRYVLDFTLQHIQQNTQATKNTIYNFVDVKSFIPRHSDQKTNNIILFLGKLSPDKGVLILAKAANLFLRELPNVELHYVGQDTLVGEHKCSELLNDIFDEKIRSRIKLIWQVAHHQLPDLIAKARIFVNPTCYETFSITTIEAMACGKAVIASNVCSMPEIIKDGQNGILVPPNDALMLAREIITLYHNNTLRETLQLNARQTVAHLFNKEEAIKRNIQFYQGISKTCQ